MGKICFKLRLIYSWIAVLCVVCILMLYIVLSYILVISVFTFCVLKDSHMYNSLNVHIHTYVK